ncbi:MAG TPA: Spy/CpxP family protein refolding chaperone [Terriglobales bacterium]|jgi:protein CpxP|nr:Spy/CpxP family protein refolding chaperone [Terriglobales bacterium]
MNFRSKMSIAALAIVLVTGIAIAQPHGGPHGGGDFFGGGMMGFFSDYLDLTDAQQAQIKQIVAKEKPTLQPLFAQEMQSHEQMIQLIQSGTFDQAKAQAIATQEAQVHTQLEVEHARIANEAYQVLTADQKTKLAQYITKKQQRFEQHMQQKQGAQSEQAPN